MLPVLLTQGTPIAESELNHIEKTFGLSFPKIIRDFYLCHNGAKIREALLTIDNDYYNVVRFLDTAAVVILLNENKKHGVPNDYIPFAEDWGSDLYCWSTRDSGVYLFYSDSDTPLLILNSLNRFIELVHNCTQ